MLGEVVAAVANGSFTLNGDHQPLTGFSNRLFVGANTPWCSLPDRVPAGSPGGGIFRHGRPVAASGIRPGGAVNASVLGSCRSFCT